MKTIATLVLWLALAVLAGIGLVLAWPFIENILPAQITSKDLLVGLVGTGVFFTALSFGSLFRESLRWKKYRDNSQAYESDIRRRFTSISSHLPKKNEISNLDVKLQELEAQIQAFQSGVAGQPADAKPELNIVETDTKNVIQLDPELHAVKRKSGKTRYRVPADLGPLIKKDAIQAYLQPTVRIGDRQVIGYEALARLILEDGTVVPASAFIRKAETTNLISKIDLKMLEQIMVTLRASRREKLNPVIFWNVSPDTLDSKTAFSPIKEILTAGKSLSQMLVIEVSQADYITMSKKGVSRLASIRSLGYKICIDKTSDLEAAKQLKDGKLISYIKSSMEVLGQPDENGTEIQAASLLQDLAGTGIEIIATEIEDDNQVMRLIDADVLLGQGNVFSPAKAPKTRKSAKTTTASKAGTARR